MVVTQAREFPVHVKFEDWMNDDDELNSDVEQYLRDLATESGGAGLAIGLILSIAMFFGIVMFWCCPCCCFDTCCLCCRKDKENDWSEKANRRCGCAMLTLSLLMCAAGVGLLYPTTVDTLEKGDNAMGNAGNSVVDSMNFLCGEPLTSYLIENGHESYEAYSAGRTAQEMCATGSSLVQYLTDTSCKLNSTLNSVEDFIDGLSDIVSALDNITGAIGLLETGVDAMEAAALSVDQQCGTDLDTSVQNVNSYAGSITTGAGNVPVLTTLDAPGITVDPSIFTQIDQAQVDVADAKSNAQTSKDEAQSTIETDLQGTTKDEIETAKNDAQTEITDAQSDILENVPDLAEAHSKITEARNDYYGEYEDYILIGYLSFFGLGFLFVLISLLGFWRMNTCCVQCGGCMIFLVTFWLCAFMGFTVLMWMITGDVCDNIWTGNTKSGNRGLFQVNLANETVDIQNITINVAEKVEAVLRCQGGCTDIESTCNDLPSMSDTNTGCDSTNNLLDILAVQDEFNFTSEIQPSIDDILAYAPDLNYSSQIDTARQSLNTDAVNDALNYDYDFSGNLTEVKTQIANFSALVPLCESSCDDATVSGESDSWQAIWLVGASDVNCAYLTSTTIDGSDTYYSSNCNLVSLIENIDTSVDSCNASTLNVTASQTLIANGISSVDTALGSADATILLKQDELVQQADLLGVLIAYIPEEAPGHLTCSWISGAWSTTIEGDVCTHAYDSMQAAFPGMALCIFGMLLAFFSMMDCANPNRIRVKQATSEGGVGSARWDHPLAHPDGAIDEEGRVRVPETPKKYWNRDSTTVVAVDGPMNNSSGGGSPIASARHAEPTAEVVAISSSSSNLYGL